MRRKKQPEKKRNISSKGQTTIKSSQPSTHAVVIKMKMIRRFICLNHVYRIVVSCFISASSSRCGISFECFLLCSSRYSRGWSERSETEMWKKGVQQGYEWVKLLKATKNQYWSFRNSIRFGTLLSLASAGFAVVVAVYWALFQP